MEDIEANLLDVRRRIALAARRAGRSPEEVTLVGVTKTVPTERIKVAIGAGLTDIGENRVQEARDKFRVIGGDVRWHLVGHLQRNKVKPAIEIFSLIHSLDSERLAMAIEDACARINKVQDVLVEVNISGEESKAGIAPEETLDFLRLVAQFEHIRVLGLMGIAPVVVDPEDARPFFRRMKELFDEAKEEHIPGLNLRYLSMGMTNDFEVAIEEGANIVRIGRAIFGERPTPQGRCKT